MSSNTSLILQVENVGKKFLIYDNPRARLAEILYNPLRKLAGAEEKKYHQEFWALKDISFNVERGETVGIIGRNGAGKSTLLQIITGTLNPSDGAVTCGGRISGLLELGAGFNPEFSGIDNIFLNSAILGLNETEILERLDDIIAFADIGDFIHQPVKTYSSGMYVRLAFSVAIHVRPDLLIIDEALAVGDAVFQSKCMHKLRRMVDDGVSLLFVSHDISAVKSLCQRALLLECGVQHSWGSTSQVANEYTKLVHRKKQEDAVNFISEPPVERTGNLDAEYLSVELIDSQGLPRQSYTHGEDIHVRCAVRANRDLSTIGVGIHIRDRTGIDLTYLDNLLEQKVVYDPRSGDIYQMEWIMPNGFARGRYDIAVVVSRPDQGIDVRDARSNDFILCDFLPVAAQFNVIGEWDIYASLRFGTLKDIRLLANQSADVNPITVPSESAQLNLAEASNPTHLHLGCGNHILKGWTNVDLLPRPDIYRWDLSRPLPIPRESVDYIFCEHFLEHLNKKQGEQFVRDCFNILKPGGVLRLSTPSLDFLFSTFQSNNLEEWADVGWQPTSRADLVNEGMRSWGHQYLYDQTTLEELLHLAGFHSVHKADWRDSLHQELKNLECRPYHQDLIFEATK